MMASVSNASNKINGELGFKFAGNLPSLAQSLGANTTVPYLTATFDEIVDLFD